MRLLGTKWLFVGLLFVLGCAGGPYGPIAGARLEGTVATVPVRDWSFAKTSEYVDLEVRQEDPYSVTIHYYVVGGALYVEAGDNYWSRWRPMLWEDGLARVRFSETVYPVHAVAVTDPEEIARVLPAFYKKDRDEPSAACRVHWDVGECAFQGRFYRLDSVK